jgi:hypothetical protein
MSSQPAGSAGAAADAQVSAPQQTQRPERMERREGASREMPCPVCGEPMPDLKGGKGTICPNCGFKDSCCY